MALHEVDEGQAEMFALKVWNWAGSKLCAAPSVLCRFLGRQHAEGRVWAQAGVGEAPRHEVAATGRRLVSNHRVTGAMLALPAVRNASSRRCPLIRVSRRRFIADLWADNRRSPRSASSAVPTWPPPRRLFPRTTERWPNDAVLRSSAFGVQPQEPISPSFSLSAQPCFDYVQLSRPAELCLPCRW